VLLEYSRGECIKVIGEMWEVPREVYAIYIRKKFATGRRVIEDAALERVFELANDITGDVQQLCAQSEIWVWIVAEPPEIDFCFKLTRVSIFATAVTSETTRVIKSMTAVLSETNRVIKSMTTVLSETTRVIQSMTAVSISASVTS
jgi:hypothetical protein